MKPFKLWSSTKASTPRCSSCTSFWLLVPFLCFFLSIRFLEVLRGRRQLLYPNLLKRELLMTTWTTNGFLEVPSRKRLEAKKLLPVKGRPTSVTLAPILNEFQVQERKIEFQDTVEEPLRNEVIHTVLNLFRFFYVSHETLFQSKFASSDDLPILMIRF